MKTGFKNTNEFCDFLRDINAIEETYVKSLSKLSKQAASLGTSGSFKLWWAMFSSFLEKSVSLRSDIESEHSTLWRDVQKYLDEQQKKQRILKDNEFGTQEVVHSFQVATSHLQKAKEFYHARYKEFERIRLNEAHSTRDIDKAEAKLKKAQDEYRYSVEKYNNLRLQFVDKMRISCDRFEQMELAHLTQMYEFFGRFTEALVRSQRTHLSLVMDFNQQRSLELKPEHLLLNIIQERGTGRQEPSPAEFEDVEVTAAFLNTDEACADSLTSQCSPSYVASTSNNLRASSALPAFGSQESPIANHQSPLSLALQVSLNAINGTHSSGPSRRAGVLFQRRNRQYSAGLEADTSSMDSSGGTAGSFAQRLANVRNLTRLQRKTSNSPNEMISKAAPPSTSMVHHSQVDDDGYNIRPANPWVREHSRSPSSRSAASRSSSSSPSEKTFKGLKVNIRPLGDLSPGAAEVPQPTSPRLTSSSNFASFAVRDFRRPHTSADEPFVTLSPAKFGIKGDDGVMGARSNSVATTLPVPILPPPPGQDTISSRRGGRKNVDLLKALDSTEKVDEGTFNPFGLPRRDEVTPTPKMTGSWEAVFSTPEDTAETYDRLLEFQDEGDKAQATPELPQSPASEAKLCHAPLAALEDDDTLAPSVPLQIPRFSTEPRALPPPVPPLPIAIALTETWRAQFPNGGGSSFTTTERPAQSLFGQVTMAVAREDLRLLTHIQKPILKPLILVFLQAQRMRSVQATFSGVSVQSEGEENTRQYRVRIPGDLLYHYLVETQSESPGSGEEEYTRLCLLDYAVEATGLPPPITMCTFWRCEKASTDFRLDYFVQWPKWSSTSPLDSDKGSTTDVSSCQDLRVNLMVDGGVVRMQSLPLGTWNTEQIRASWNIPLNPAEPSQQKHPGVDVSGNIRAKFFLSRGPGTPQPVALQFCRDGGSLPSGAVLSLSAESLPGDGGGGYRLTMCKYRLLGDRYFCDPPVPIRAMTHCLPFLPAPSSKAQQSS